MNAPGAGFRDGSSARRRCHGPFMISSFAARVTLLLLPVPVDIVYPPRDFRPGFRGLDHPAAGGAPGMAVRHRELWWTFEDVGGRCVQSAGHQVSAQPFLNRRAGSGVNRIDPVVHSGYMLPPS